MTDHRIGRIDGLRAVAALMVLAFHAQILRPQSAFEVVTLYGTYGVQLFFFISGYVISLSWDQQSGTAANFYWRRMLRLCPLYFLLLVLSYFFGWANSPEQELNGINFVLHALFVHGFSSTYSHAGIAPMWSLTSEVVFYIAFPWLRRISTVWLIVLLVVSLHIPDADTSSPGWLSLTPFGALKYFALGMLVYRHQDFFSSSKALALSGAFALALVGGAIGQALDVRSPIWTHDANIALLFACPWLMLSRSTILSALVDNAASRFTGRISYSIYLWQAPVMFELMKAGLPMQFPFFFALVWLISAGSFYLIERPFTAKRFKPSLPATIRYRTPQP